MTPDKYDELVFLPLGGCNEIGMNFNAYGYGPPENRRWVIVDVGVTFGDHTTPGIDIITPDPTFIEDQADQIEAIFLTHAHEDHIGAIGHLWPRLKAQVYATPFTAELVRNKLHEVSLAPDELLNVVPLGGKVEVGPFELEYITLTHSIPEPNGLAIKTPLGLILHTGDWKIDTDPLIGADFDADRVQALGDEGILAMVCDSTNVFVEGEAGSELGCRKALIDLVGEQTGRVAIAAFASNVARLESAIKAAEANQRHVCLVGRSMHKITAAAKAVGLLADAAPFLDESEAAHIPPEHILYLCTGSQGEPRAALSKIAREDHPHVKLGQGDSVIFSSRVIPGNERGIFDLQNALADKGVRIITERMAPIHVSGHPCRDELRRMYALARPQIAVPVHGERRHIIEHAAFAESLQVPNSVTPRNGDLVHLAPRAPFVVDTVPAGRLHLDGNRLVPENSAGLMERRRLSYGGQLTVSMAILENGRVQDGPYVTARGFSENDGGQLDDSLDVLEEAADHALESASRKDMASDEAIERLMVRRLKRTCDKLFGKRPSIDVHILRV